MCSCLCELFYLTFTAFFLDCVQFCISIPALPLSATLLSVLKMFLPGKSMYSFTSVDSIYISVFTNSLCSQFVNFYIHLAVTFLFLLLSRHLYLSLKGAHV